MKNTRFFVWLLWILVFSAGIVFWNFQKFNFSQLIPEKTNITIQKQENPWMDLKLLWETYGLIKDNYITFDKVSTWDLIYGMIKGMVWALKDKHTEYFNPEETKKFNEVIAGDFEGIGAVIQKNDFGVYIERLLAGSPAKEADMRAGDVVTKANEVELKDLDLIDAVNKIRGPAGTNVKLEIIRVGEPQKIIKNVIRRKIDVPSVDSKTFSGSIGYIALSIFWEKTAENFQQELLSLYKQDAKWLIIDLRDNGGGLLDSAVEILSHFIEKDKLLVVTKEKNIFENRSYFSYGINYPQGTKFPKNTPPIVLLINENSASASEIVSWALKDYKLAILVGDKSYGKGSVQQPFTLSDGSEIKITVAKWYTPLDHGIDGIGIKPDIQVLYEKEDYEKKYDRQLEEAKKILNTFIETKDYQKTIDIYTTEKTAPGTTQSGIINK